MINSISYFEARNVAQPDGSPSHLPPWADRFLPKTQTARILDLGCGHGGLLLALKAKGYANVVGVEQDEAAVRHCRDNGLHVHALDILSANLDLLGTFDLITMTHVLEHIPKADMIDFLGITKRMLAPGGCLYIAVPNAQANTGAYWAFEDFTHHYLFTSGSLYFVARMAGFTQIDFLDIDCTDGNSFLVKWSRRTLLALYRTFFGFWNKVTRSSFHNQSAQIFSYEIKALIKP